MRAKVQASPGGAVISIAVVFPPSNGNLPVHRSVAGSRLPQFPPQGRAHDSNTYDWPPGTEIAVGAPSLSRNRVSSVGPVTRR